MHDPIPGYVAKSADWRTLGAIEKIPQKIFSVSVSQSAGVLSHCVILTFGRLSHGKDIFLSKPISDSTNLLKESGAPLAVASSGLPPLSELLNSLTNIDYNHTLRFIYSLQHTLRVSRKQRDHSVIYQIQRQGKAIVKSALLLYLHCFDSRSIRSRNSDATSIRRNKRLKHSLGSLLSRTNSPLNWVIKGPQWLFQPPSPQGDKVLSTQFNDLRRP